MRNQIEQLVSQLTGNGTMFTAWDITMMLRRANPTTNIRHPEVRDIIHQMYTDNEISGYIRTTHDVGGNQPFVHHPYGSDVEDYDPNFLSQHTPTLSPIQTSIQAVVNPIQATSTFSKAKRSRYSPDNVPKDKFGRIRIPASILRTAGFSPKDNVFVVVDPNIITVTSSTDSYGINNGKKYVVDEYNNVRVHLKDKFQAANAFKMAPSQSKVYITPV